MKYASILITLALMQFANAEEKTVSGTVTYVAVGTVYTTLGRDSGVRDSSMIYVKSGNDTLAILQVMAVSSKSSACKVMKSKRDVRIGNIVVARVQIEPTKPDTASVVVSAGSSPVVATSVGLLRKSSSVQGVFVMRGRVSAQYYVNRYDIEAYNTTQPGLVINLRGKSNEIPLRFEVYSNIRTLSYGNSSPFSKTSVNQSRVYRLSVDYDDGMNDLSVGRIIPSVAPAIGYIDGMMFSRKFGALTLGTTFGYQPSYTLRGVSSDYKKMALFASVQPDSMNLVVSTAYARTYYLSALDREVVSGTVSLYTQGGFQVYGYSEVDLRSISGGEYLLSPSLTSLFMNVSYRVTRLLTLGIGTDASRPLYTFSTARLIPDSLRETRVRSGINTSISFYLPGGVTLSNTYAPRTSESSFASVYTNYTTIGISNLFSSGVSVRSNFNLNANEYSSSNGYGVSLQKNIASVVDINLRFQQNTYSLKNYDDKHISRTVGSDMIINLSRTIGVMVSYDRLNGYGITSNSIFGELSVRF